MLSCLWYYDKCLRSFYTYRKHRPYRIVWGFNLINELVGGVQLNHDRCGVKQRLEPAEGVQTKGVVGEVRLIRGAATEL